MIPSCDGVGEMDSTALADVALCDSCVPSPPEDGHFPWAWHDSKYISSIHCL